MRRLYRSEPVVDRQDPLRWVTFSGFWGLILFLLSVVGLVAGQERSQVRISRRTAGVTLLIHMLAFVSGGTLFSLVQQVLVGRGARQQSRQAIRSGLLERSIPLQALGSAAGAVVPFGMVVAEARLAARLTGEPLLAPGRTNWPRALTVTSALSGLVALAVTRIAGWVAQDARARR